MPKMKKAEKVRGTEEIIADLAPAYKKWKAGEKEKKKLHPEFFEAITRELRENPTGAEDLVVVTASSEEAARAEVAKQYPGWELEDIRPHPDMTDTHFEVIIKEDPAFAPFTIEYDGQVWGRQVVAGSTYVDDELMEEKDVDLWMDVTEYPMEDFLRDLVYEAGIQEPSEVEPHIMQVAERHGIPRKLKPFDDMSPLQLERIKDFMYEGPPSVKLPAPKKAEGSEG